MQNNILTVEFILYSNRYLSLLLFSLVGEGWYFNRLCKIYNVMVHLKNPKNNFSKPNLNQDGSI